MFFWPSFFLLSLSLQMLNSSSYHLILDIQIFVWWWLAKPESSHGSGSCYLSPVPHSQLVIIVIASLGSKMAFSACILLQYQF